MAKLYFRYGAMNCGKTTAIIQVAHNYEEKWMRVALIKPKIDSKWWEHISSRLGVTRKADVLLDRADSIKDIMQTYQKTNGDIDCLLIDEVQFLMPSQIDELYWFALDEDVPVICYGLRTDFLLQSFPASERLLALAHTLEELKNICNCGKKAVCNMRIVNGKPVFSGDQIAIDDGEITYEAVCGMCYANHKKWII